MRIEKSASHFLSPLNTHYQFLNGVIFCIGCEKTACIKLIAMELAS